MKIVEDAERRADAIDASVQQHLPSSFHIETRGDVAQKIKNLKLMDEEVSHVGECISYGVDMVADLYHPCF